MRIDRDFQRAMLEHLRDSYPQESFEVYTLIPGRTEDAYDNLTYLAEHGLVKAGIRTFLDSSREGMGATITAKGLDFISDDGGLSATLNTVTVKFHGDTLRQLIADKIESAAIPPQEKGALTKAVQEMPAEAVKTLTTKLMEKGLENMPQAIALIQSLLKGLS